MAHTDRVVIYNLSRMREKRNLNRTRQKYLEYAPPRPRAEIVTLCVKRVNT